MSVGFRNSGTTVAERRCTSGAGSGLSPPPGASRSRTSTASEYNVPYQLLMSTQ